MDAKLMMILSVPLLGVSASTGLETTGLGAPAPTPNYGFTFLGQGECRQRDGEYALEYNTWFPELDPWTSGTNAPQATARCQEVCAQYSWCFAAEVILNKDWPTPMCSLITDRPTFEAYNGGGQDYSWAARKEIDGVEYQTYCNGGNPACAPGNTYASNWNGGKLRPRTGYWCYINNNPGATPVPTAVPIPTPSPTPSPITPPSPYAGFTLLGEGECRQKDGHYGLEYEASYGGLRPWASGDHAARATTKCQKACAKYAWCFAANVLLVKGWDSPKCHLVTDRPTFEAYNGGGQDYSWGADKTMDGVRYMTLCGGGNPACSPSNTVASNWNGGKLSPRTGFWCYIKDSPGIQLH